MKTFEPGEHFPIAFDIDGIVLDTATEMWAAITAYLGLTWKLERWTDYDIGNVIGVPTYRLRSVYEPILLRTDLPGVPGAADALTQLYFTFKQPLLFITSRRAQFKQPALQAIKSLLAPDVEFELLCTGDTQEEEFRNNKLPLLKRYQVEVFVEDNWIYWEDYTDSGIQVLTLKWPWTEERVVQLWKETGKIVGLYTNWDTMSQAINKHCLGETIGTNSW